MGRRGPRQLDVEARYWDLLAAGVGTVEACRAVGITRKTGYRWRVERRYLSALERRRIATLRGQELGVREIARRIGREQHDSASKGRHYVDSYDEVLSYGV